MQVFVVADGSSILAVLTDSTVAEKVRAVSGPNCTVNTVEVDTIYPGHKSSIKEIFGMDLSYFKDRDTSKCSPFNSF